MKKFQSLGKSLNKSEQKKINGGELAPGCPDGNQSYCCDITYTDDSTGTKDFCATGETDARIQAIHSASNVYSADCQLA